MAIHSLHAGYFFMFMLLSAYFFQNKLFFKNFFQEHYYQSVKLFRSRSGPDLGKNCLQLLSADDQSL